MIPVVFARKFPHLLALDYSERQFAAELLLTPEVEMEVAPFEASRVELPGLVDPFCELRSFRFEGGSAAPTI